MPNGLSRLNKVPLPHESTRKTTEGMGEECQRFHADLKSLRAVLDYSPLDSHQSVICDFTVSATVPQRVTHREAKLQEP